MAGAWRCPLGSRARVLWGSGTRPWALGRRASRHRRRVRDPAAGPCGGRGIREHAQGVGTPVSAGLRPARPHCPGPEHVMTSQGVGQAFVSGGGGQVDTAPALPKRTQLTPPQILLRLTPGPRGGLGPKLRQKMKTGLLNRRAPSRGFRKVIICHGFEKLTIFNAQKIFGARVSNNLLMVRSIEPCSRMPPVLGGSIDPAPPRKRKPAFASTYTPRVSPHRPGPGRRKGTLWASCEA